MLTENSQFFQLSLGLESPIASAARQGGAGIVDSNINGFEKTPVSNTGSKSQDNNSNSTVVSGQGFGNWEPWQPDYEPWIDYLQGTGCCLFGELRAIMDFFQQQTTDRFVPHFGTGYYVGNRRYANSYSSLLGIIINWQRRDFNADIDINDNAEIDLDKEFRMIDAEMPVNFHISIPGKPLNAIGAKNGIELCKLLSDSYSFSCSRIDCKVRNHSWVVDFDKLDSAISSGDVIGGDYYTRYDSGSIRQNFKARSQEKPIVEGKTRVFGSPKSDKRVTFYDARPLHKVDAIDIEVRFRKKLAKSAFASILAAVNNTESLRIIQGIVAGAIDFRHKIEGERNIKRCDRYLWWEQFNNAVGGAIRISRPRKVIDVVKQKQWLEEKCFRVLGMTKELMGSAYFHKWMDDLCKHGKEAMTKTQEAYIDVYKELNLHRIKFIPYRNDEMSAMPLR